MYGLMAAPASGGGGGEALDDLNASREMAFVITDLEASTAMANADGAAFAKVQEIHDMVRPLPSIMHSWDEGLPGAKQPCRAAYCLHSWPPHAQYEIVQLPEVWCSCMFPGCAL
jgi:hypothetical protein